MPILNITYCGYLMAVCVMSVYGNGLISVGYLSLATRYVHIIVTLDNIAPKSGNICARKPNNPFLVMFKFGYCCN